MIEWSYGNVFVGVSLGQVIKKTFKTWTILHTKKIQIQSNHHQTLIFLQTLSWREDPYHTSGI